MSGPNQIVVESLGIGISQETNDNLNLSGTQRLIVGESIIVNGEKTYGLIVDEQGVAVNATLPDRASFSNEYALFVDGNVFVRGSLVSGSGSGSGSNSGSNYWLPAASGTNGIYFPGKVTFGNQGNFTAATSNNHALNICESSTRNIENAQISIQNTQQSQMRFGIIGTSATSPAILNTAPGVPLEFHASRNQDYFAPRYMSYSYESGVLTSNLTETPVYTDVNGLGISSSNAPHMLIDTAGNVGIHTSEIPIITYNQVPEFITLGGSTFPNVSEAMALHVDGSFFSSNIITLDYQTGEYSSIDELYIRRLGTTLLANQIIPGQFAKGYYLFQSNVSIGNETDLIDPEYDLTVHGTARIRDRFTVDGVTTLNYVEIKDSVLLDIASFCNDVYVNRDVIVKESIRLRGGFFTEVPEGSNVTWCNVQFTVASPSYSNINLLGAGITTPGRLGIGIDPQFDEVNNQFVIRKRSRDIFEQEIYDLSDFTRLHKAAYIGHPPTGESRANDGSLIIATPSPNDPDFNLAFPTGAPQNIYFYPAQVNLRDTTPIIRDGNPPTLNVHNESRVGILTYDPLTELDVRGNISLTERIYKITDYTENIDYETPAFAEFLEQNYANIYPENGIGATFRGVGYINPDAPYIGFNTLPDPRYGLTVAGGLKIADDMYNSDNYRVGYWIDGNDASNIDPTSSSWHPICTIANVGIGVTAPVTNLDVKNTRSGPTSMRLIRSDTSIDTIFQMGNVSSPWQLKTNDSDLFSCSYAGNPVWFAKGRQMVIGEDVNVFTNSSNTRPSARLTVDGDASVIGNMYVSGGYYAAGSFVVNTNCNLSNLPPISQDDVFIGGNKILIVPTQGMMINYTQALLDQESADKTPFRVYQTDTLTPTIARFRGATNNALVEITNRLNDSFKFGIYEQNNRASFAFLDKNNQPYLAFSSNQTTSEKYFSFNAIVEEPTASLHVQNGFTGCNMIKLSRYGQGADLAGYAPELEFEKIINGPPTLNNAWIMRGPDSRFNQKLTLNYRAPGASRLGSEMFTFTNNGCIGIGNTQPDFAIDIVGSGKLGSIRMLNTSNSPLPQLIFQSGSTEYGTDSLTDYRFYSASNEFYLDMQNSNVYKKLLHFNETGNLGILAEPTAEYAANIGGFLNVKSGILLNNLPLFTAEGASSNLGVNIQANNIFLTPNSDAFGGVGVNTGDLGGATCNLMHIYTNKNPNALTLDSAFVESQLNFKIINSSNAPVSRNIGRMAFSNDNFVWSFQSNATSEPYIDGSSVGYSTGARLSSSGLSLTGTLDIAGSAVFGASSGKLLINPTSSVCINASGTASSGVATAYIDVLATSNLNVMNLSHARTGRVITISSNIMDSTVPIKTTGLITNSITTTDTETLNINNQFYITSNSIIANNSILPSSNNIYDLGSPTARWKDLYLSSNSLDLNGTRISQDPDTRNLVINDWSTAELKGLLVDSINLNNQVSIIAGSNAGSPLIFQSIGVDGQIIEYNPVVQSAEGNGGISIGTEQAEAALHIVSASNDTKPCMILNHLGSPSNIMTILSSNIPQFTVFSDGGVAIRSSQTSNSSLYVGASMNSQYPIAIFGDNKVIIQNDGSLNINGALLNLSGAAEIQGLVSLGSNMNINGNLNVTGDIVNQGNVITVSDMRIKNEIAPITSALDKLMTLGGYTYVKTGQTRREAGVIAQELREVIPECVHEDPNTGTLSVAYNGLFGLLIEAIKELANK